MRLVHLACLATLGILMSVTFANARCQGAIMLAQLHDAYLATLNETGARKRNAARTLLVVIGGKNPTALARQLKRSGLQIEQERLNGTMQNAAEFAHDLLLGSLQPNNTTSHRNNVDWLAAVVHNVRCRSTVTVPARAYAATGPYPDKKSFSKENRKAFPWVKTTLASLAILAASIFVFKKSGLAFAWRVKQAARLPRVPFSMKLSVTLTDADHEMQQATVTGLDVSAGGMKLDWPDPPPQGTILTLSLPFGERLATIVWSNAYFAGVMFDDFLDKSELRQLHDDKV